MKVAVVMRRNLCLLLLSGLFVDFSLSFENEYDDELDFEYDIGALRKLESSGNRRTRGRGRDSIPKDQEEIANLCKDRSSEEYFRLSANGDCRVVVRCDNHGGAGGIRQLSQVKCPSGLGFDIFRQTCDWKSNVDNCDVLSKPRLAKPNLVTLEPVCPGENQIQCGSGECLPKNVFCDNTPDCSDGSDENACSFDEDPNRVEDCDPARCLLPDCYCSADGTLIPGGSQAEINQTPMMITLSFNGAITGINGNIYDEIFTENRLNPNGCTVKGTFFVSHKFTNYSAVQEIHRKGHEIAMFSITNKDDTKYWTNPDYDDWLGEMAGCRLILETFANITDGSIIGVRAPYLLTGGNTQFAVMSDQFMAYDASITVPLADVPVWPYTLQYRIPHKCTGSGNCPSRSYAIWELPINELDRREDPEFDEVLTGCSLVSSCSNIYEKEQFRSFLEHNFIRHYSTNRAPLSLSFDSSWLKSNKGFSEVLGKWMDDILVDHNEVYFVTHLQVIQWMQSPVSVTGLREFLEWKTNCKVNGQPFCSLPTPCPVSTRELPGEIHRLHTCMPCPKHYPWIADPTGNGFSFK